MYQQEKDEKDEEDDAIDDERRDKCRDRAALRCRAVRHPRASSTRNSNRAVKVGGNRVGSPGEGAIMHRLFILISAFTLGSLI